MLLCGIIQSPLGSDALIDPTTNLPCHGLHDLPVLHLPTTLKIMVLRLLISVGAMVFLSLAFLPFTNWRILTYA